MEERIKQLISEGLVLEDYDWSDVENGLIKNLSFSYHIKDGTKGMLELGDIEIDMYLDDDDVCVDVDLFNNYYFEADFDWDDFYNELADYYEYD